MVVKISLMEFIKKFGVEYAERCYFMPVDANTPVEQAPLIWFDESGAFDDETYKIISDRVNKQKGDDHAD